MLKKKNWVRTFPKDFEKRKRGTIKASDLPPKGSGRREKVSAVALVKEDGLDLYFQIAPYAIFEKCKKMIPA